MKVSVWLFASLAILALAAAAIPYANERREQFRGEPIFLEYGFGLLLVTAIAIVLLSQVRKDAHPWLVPIAVVLGYLGFLIGAARFD